VTLRALCESGAEDACALTNSDNAADGLRVRPFLTDWDFRTIPLSDLMDAGGNSHTHVGELGEIVLLARIFPIFTLHHMDQNLELS
jgi:hypothetical protein